MVEILRKYIRYALNEKPFNPDLVASLIHLRRASGLDDSQIPEILNEISRRIVKEKGVIKQHKVLHLIQQSSSFLLLALFGFLQVLL